MRPLDGLMSRTWPVCEPAARTSGSTGCQAALVIFPGRPYARSFPAACAWGREGMRLISCLARPQRTPEGPHLAFSGQVKESEGAVAAAQGQPAGVGRILCQAVSKAAQASQRRHHLSSFSSSMHGCSLCSHSGRRGSSERADQQAAGLATCLMPSCSRRSDRHCTAWPHLAVLPARLAVSHGQVQPVHPPVQAGGCHV